MSASEGIGLSRQSQRGSKGKRLCRDALSFLWEGQEGLFELASREGTGLRRRRNQLFTKADALSRFGAFDYFGILSRQSRGLSKRHVSSTGNVLWVDFDSLELDSATLAAVAKPSLVICSGRGYWLYWKLTAHVECSELEERNRRAAELLGGDRGAWNRDRLARLPGAPRPELHTHARVAELDGTVYLPSLFKVEAGESVFDEHADATIYLDDPPILSEDSWAYIRARQNVSYRGGGRYDRSREEQKIFVRLVYQGWTDERIVHFADQTKLPRHSYERERLGNLGWTLRSIAAARRFVAEHPADPAERDDRDRGTALARHARRREALQLVSGQTTLELVAAIIAQTGVSRATAFNTLEGLRRMGYVSAHRSGRTVRNNLTAEGQRKLASRKGFLTLRRRAP